MKFQTKYNILLYKSYLDSGLGLTAYFKYFIALFAIASSNVPITLWITLVYFVCCFFIGYFWFKHEWVLAGAEVGNKYNLFVKEMRKSVLVSKQRQKR